MTGIEMLFFSAIAAASPTTPVPWFSMEDYPIRAFQRRQEGVTVFDVVVTPEGRPAQCMITKSSGHYLLDDQVCLVASKRIRFSPAFDSAGRPTYGVYTSRVNWALDPENWSQSEAGPDFEVSLNKLPDGVTSPVSVKYAVLVDASGKALDCRAITTGYGNALGDLGCAKIKQDYHQLVALAPGSPVSGVRTTWITFTK